MQYNLFDSSAQPSHNKNHCMEVLRYGLIISLGLLTVVFFLPAGLARHWMIPILLASAGTFGGVLLQQPHIKKGCDDFLEKRWIASCFLCGLFIFFSALYFGMHHLGGCDQSDVIDTAWRIYNGQAPYHDFPCNFPPGFYLGLGLSFKLFGPHWYSQVLMNALYGTVTFFWSCWLLKKIEESRMVALLLAIFLQMLTTVLASFWWYNPITTIPAALFFLSALLYFRKGNETGVVFSYLASLVLLAFMKPNTAGPEIIGISTILLFAKGRPLMTILLSLSGLGIFFGIFLLLQINLYDFLGSYLSASGRVGSWEPIRAIINDESEVGHFLILTVLLLLLWIVISAVRLNYKNHQQWISLVLLGASIFTMLTNGENPLIVLPCIFFAVWFLIENKIVAKAVSSYQVLIVILCFLIGLGFGEGAVRHRVMQIGPNMFFQHQISKETIPSSFFKGFRGSPLFVQLHRELTDLIFYEGNGRSFWFGPRLQWAYAAFSIPSPIHQPIWWSYPVGYDYSQEKELIRIWEQEHFDTLVFFRGDITNLPMGLLNEIKNNYVLVSNQGLLTVLHRKNQ